jgi:hypothetical protein
VRIDNPSKSDKNFILKYDEESVQKQKDFCKENLPSGLGMTKKL